MPQSRFRVFRFVECVSQKKCGLRGVRNNQWMGVKTLGYTSLTYKKPTHQIYASFYVKNPSKRIRWFFLDRELNVHVWSEALS